MKSFKQFINEQLSLDDLDDFGDDFGDDLNLFPDSLSNLKKLSEKDILFYKNLIMSDLEYDNGLAEAGLNNEGIALNDFIENHVPLLFTIYKNSRINSKFTEFKSTNQYYKKHIDKIGREHFNTLRIMENVLIRFNEPLLRKLGYSFCSSHTQIRNRTFVLCHPNSEWRLGIFPNTFSLKRMPPNSGWHGRLSHRVTTFHKDIKNLDDYKDFLIWAIEYIIENIDVDDSNLRTKRFTSRI